MRRCLAILLSLVLALFAQTGAQIPKFDHSVLNATSGIVVVENATCSRDRDITNVELQPGQAIGLHGVFRSLKVRLRNQQVISITEEQLRKLEGGIIFLPSY